MKYLMTCLLITLLYSSCSSFKKESTREVANDTSRQIECVGDGEIDGHFWGTNKSPTIFYFNSSINRNPNYAQNRENEVEAIYGHKVDLDGKMYYHTPSLASCKERNDGLIHCHGSGYGNGPKLDIIIDLDNGTGSGSYHNPWMHQVGAPNSSNTYQYPSLSCREV